MSLSTMSNFTNQKSSLRPTNARQSVGDGAASFDTSVPSVLAVCHLEGNDDMYYYSTTFSGGPGSKCPPDRGSSDCVTGSPASYFSSPASSVSSSPTSSFSTSPVSMSGTRAFTKSIAYSPTTAAPITTIDYTHGRFQQPSRRNGRANSAIVTTTPRAIPAPARSGSSTSSGFSTPPLTPDDGSYSSGGSIDSVSLDPINQARPAPISPKAKAGAQSKDALEYLMTIFPKDGLKALPHSKSVSVSAPTLDAEFEGVVLQLPGKPRTVYIDGKNAASVSLRESIVALLDLAAENLGCNALVIVLERSAPNLGELLHSLMYVGGSVVTKPPFAVDPAFVLVGMEV